LCFNFFIKTYFSVALFVVFSIENTTNNATEETADQEKKLESKGGQGWAAKQSTLARPYEP
jgi:hypothetical protein